MVLTDCSAIQTWNLTHSKIPWLVNPTELCFLIVAHDFAVYVINSLLYDTIRRVILTRAQKLT